MNFELQIWGQYFVLVGALSLVNHRGLHQGYGASKTSPFCVSEVVAAPYICVGKNNERLKFA